MQKNKVDNVTALLQMRDDMKSYADAAEKLAESIAVMADVLISIGQKHKAELDALEHIDPPADETKSAESKANEKPVTLEDVRAVLAKRSAEGLKEKVKSLLQSHGAKRLSDVKPEEYSTLLAEAEVLKDA